MPLIDGGEKDSQAARAGRTAGSYREHTKLLLVAAVIMSVLLILSSLVTTLLIDPAEYREGGKASGRANRIPGAPIPRPGFGTVYDVSTILILGLPAPLRWRPFSTSFHVICRASEWRRAGRLCRAHLSLSCSPSTSSSLSSSAPPSEAQSGAYATGVLVLILSAAFRRDIGGCGARAAGGCSCTWVLLCLVFGFTLADNCLERPDGLVIGIHSDPASYA
jgi:hypothetical protein